VRGEIEVATVGDARELGPADRVQVLDVARGEGVVGELVRLVGPNAEMGLADSEPRVPAIPLVDPVLEPRLRLLWGHEVLHLHLLELERPEDEVAGGDLVAEGLADLRNAERRLAARDLRDVLEVDEDALSCLGTEVGILAGLLDGTDARPEHQVEPGAAR
jgi:hypothetical protein